MQSYPISIILARDIHIFSALRQSTITLLRIFKEAFIQTNTSFITPGIQSLGIRNPCQKVVGCHFVYSPTKWVVCVAIGLGHGEQFIEIKARLVSLGILAEERLKLFGHKPVEIAVDLEHFHVLAHSC